MVSGYPLSDAITIRHLPVSVQWAAGLMPIYRLLRHWRLRRSLLPIPPFSCCLSMPPFPRLVPSTCESQQSLPFTLYASRPLSRPTCPGLWMRGAYKVVGHALQVRLAPAVGLSHISKYPVQGRLAAGGGWWQEQLAAGGGWLHPDISDFGNRTADRVVMTRKGDECLGMGSHQ